VKALFVTGTDTGVGKTFISLALIAAWRRTGLRVGVFKPCETGCTPCGIGPGDGVLGDLLPDDASHLLAAAASGQSLDEVCPYRFHLPMAPAEAAAVEGRDEVSLSRCGELFRSIRARYDVTLVEGAGGLLVPFCGAATTVDLIRELDIPVLVVARLGLGTINHSCLTVEAARARGLEVLGLVFSRGQDPGVVPPGPDEERNPDTVARLAQVSVWGRVPWIPDHDPERAGGSIDTPGILTRL